MEPLVRGRLFFLDLRFLRMCPFACGSAARRESMSLALRLDSRLDFIALASFFVLAQVRFSFKQGATEITLEFGNFTGFRRIRLIAIHWYFTAAFRFCARAVMLAFFVEGKVYAVDFSPRNRNLK